MQRYRLSFPAICSCGDEEAYLSVEKKNAMQVKVVAAVAESLAPLALLHCLGSARDDSRVRCL